MNIHRGANFQVRGVTCPRSPRDDIQAQAEIESFSSTVDGGLATLKTYLVREFERHVGFASYHEDSRWVKAAPLGIITPPVGTISSSHPPSNHLVSSHTPSRPYKSIALDDDYIQRTNTEVSVASNSTVVQIGADDKNFVPSLGDKLLTPLDRWGILCQLLMTRKANVRQSSVYHMHPCWSGYYRMLVHNDGNCQIVFEAAMQKLRARNKVATFSSIGSGQKHRFSPLYSEGGTPRILIDPESRFCRCWLFMLFLVLCCETFVLPIGAVFELEDSDVLKATLWFGSVFWATDIIVNLACGKYSDAIGGNGAQFHYRCLKDRIIFDVLLVLIDWTLLVVTQVQESQSAGVVGVTLRIVRLVRLLRLVRLQSLLRDAFAMGGRSVIVLSGVLKATLGYFIYVHLLACFWYAIGRSSNTGWARGCGGSSRHDANCYVISLHWAMTQTHGTTKLELNTTEERIFSICATAFGLLQFGVLLGTIVDATTKFMGVDKLELRQRCVNLAGRHQLSRPTAMRVVQIIDSSDVELHLDRKMQQEHELLSILPVSLQAEVLEEMRRPLLDISILHELRVVSSKMLTKLCSDSITWTIITESEFVFSVGDRGSHWRIVDTGALEYSKQGGGDDMWGKILNVLKSGGDRGSRVSDMSDIALMRSVAASVTASSQSWSEHSLKSTKTSPFARTLTRSGTISEMVLWTPWVHTGDLLAATDCVLLQLTMEDFHHVVQERMDTCMVAARYAQSYVKHLTQLRGSISDLFQYVDVEGTDSYTDYGADDGTRHFIFLSHFKEEAGTEATLMQGCLASFAEDCHEEITSVFLDSEDLTDLSGLQEHVINSKNLVLLLTPGVLYRPWCLVEIVTAHLNEVQIVPVEIQRPGMNFVYPGEEFYIRLQNGAELSQKDVNLLSMEGISLEDVEDALRQVFTQIALPFSPHKSRQVRDAELGDIMRRCASRDESLRGTASWKLPARPTAFTV